MCLAVPSLIISKKDQIATVDVFGARKDISLALVSDDIGVGDYVLVHAGFAIQKLSREESLDTLQLLKELTEVMQDADNKAARDMSNGRATEAGA
jgi:hydrogenase expression/formation protein HypC